MYSDSAPNRAQVQQTLRDNSQVQVQFTKSDGTQRTLVGTLRDIPASAQPNGRGHANDEAQAIYDLEAGDWRSFRWDSLRDVQVVNNRVAVPA